MSSSTGQRARWLPSPARLRALLGVAVVALALVALEREFRTTSWNELVGELRALPWTALAMSLAAALSSYALLVVFDWQGLRLVEKHVAWPRLATTSFIANALGHSLGMAPLTGGTVRLKGYGDAGVGLADIGRIAFQVSLGFALGAWTLTGLTLAFAPAHLGDVLPGPVRLWQGVGIGGLAVLAAGLLALRAQPRRLALGRFSLRLPTRRDGWLALVVSVAELSCAAAALYVLLPNDADVSFPAFVGAYVLAILAGVISTVPAGLGVFEWTLIQLLPQLDNHALLASIVAYRLVYYVVPLAMALAALGAVAVRGPARRLSSIAGATVPAIAAAAVFAAGAWLLVVGSLPVPRDAVAAPLPLLEFSHLLGSLLGVLLLILAIGIQRCSRGAWLVTLGVLVLGIATSLIRGDPTLLTIGMAVLGVLLVLARRHFARPAAILESRFSPFWWRNVALVVLGAGWLMLFAYRNVPYRNHLWWQFELSGDAPRALRALLAVVVVLIIVALWQLLRPAQRRDTLPAANELDALQPLVDAATQTQANLVHLGDKAILRSPDGLGFLMYRRTGLSLIAMGDPVGPPASREALRWQFRELADQRDLRCVFYQVGRTDLEAYLDLGLALIKLGEEAIVDLATFSLEGPTRADQRQARNRGLRDGLRIEHVPLGAVDAWLPALRAISDRWLGGKAGTEKGFSLGWFDEDYLRRFPVSIVFDKDGQPLAFANLWLAPAGGELSIDLMRHTPDAPRGVMDVLFIELMLWGREHGYRSFNLGMAPLSGMSRHRLAARSQRVLGFVAGHGERLYGFEGLRRYKNKFAPTWQPRYLASPGGMHLPGVFLDLTRLINRGPESRVPAGLITRTLRKLRAWA
ncbi:bifunctional lysylphosphatidylglycerol flippase/synthetase MprF [Dokdonella sp. MW10]|uniref:bifunctional lysylphosphatidylglycerol flippase/synthetase MprF n=1 Tax=Dokdonella sp. MW10 TaxID=2992926 RepID=UPI003F7F31F8